MVDPREIRAGNWVLWVTGTDTNTKSFLAYKAIAPHECYDTFAKICFPIRISQAILSKCGFKREAQDLYLNREAEGVNEGLPFLRYKHSDKCWYLEKMKLWWQPVYLHQLQNLFYALLNKELSVCLGYFQNISIVGPIEFFVKPPKIHFPISKLL